VVRWIRRAVGAVLAAFLAGVVLYRFVPPPLTPLMVRHAFADGVTKDWVDLDRIAPSLVRAVIAAEDARFFQHRGVDWKAIEHARDYNARHGDEPRRGGSTITMQVARNVFLWQGKSYVRKSLEIGIAYVLELAWGKRRILEMYLNVIEWGPGVSGAEAAARRSFGIPAARLDDHEAALLAAALPNPRRWTASVPTRYLRARAGTIARRAAQVDLDPLDR
jgi:monofunctional biosynthetic peptidoglycan transglycosylase